MKKLMLFFLLFFLTPTIIYSIEYNPNRPNWKDFCPYGFENADEYIIKKSIIGTTKHWEIKEYNYWVDRKKNFQKELEFCDKVKPQYRNACYAQLIQRENRINQTTITPMQEWNRRQEAYHQAGQNYMLYDALKNKNYNINVQHYGY